MAGLPLFRKEADYEAWRWGSLWARRHGDERLQGILSDWPRERPGNWVRLVNEPVTDKEVEGLRTHPKN